MVPRCLVLFSAASICACDAIIDGFEPVHDVVLSEVNGDGSTLVADGLNDQMKAGELGKFNGGKGILVRTPDFFSGGKTKVLPASFWSNDVYAPSGLYPRSNPWCPVGSSDGYMDLSWVDCEGYQNGPWNLVTVAAVVGSGMPDMFPDYDNIQSSDWGWGVFYATDSNSGDKRCANKESGKQQYDCPGGWVDFDGNFNRDSSKKGAGNYEPGNPAAGLQGGGAGCHFEPGDALIDQDNAYTSDGSLNLVSTYNCECEYTFQDDWYHWVQTWMYGREVRADESWRGYFGKGKAPQWAVDPAACWVNNPRDMINLQNAMYLHRDEWNNGRAPLSGAGLDKDRRYWGWNEVPVSPKIDNALNWDAVIIKLPAGSGRTISDSAALKVLAKDLKTFEDNNQLKAGKQYWSDRPGSYVLLVEEFKVTRGYNRKFYCQGHELKDTQRRIVYVPKGDKTYKDGACWYDSMNYVQDDAVAV